jgi:glycolate oxidase FAD binding subunit
MIDLDDLLDAVGADGPVCPVGSGSRGGGCAEVRQVRAPGGIAWVQPDEMTVCCGAGTPVDELAAALAEVGQRTVLPPGGTVGGALAHGVSGVRQLGDGHLRDALLQTRFVSAARLLVTAGGPTVKNVSGFDLCRLLVGSRGGLGVLGEVILRTRPLPSCSQWYSRSCDDPRPLLQSVYRPASMLWDGARVWVLLEGHPRDVDETARAHHLELTDAPSVPTGGRRRTAPGAAVDLARALDPSSFVLEVGVGALHLDDPSAAGPEPDRPAGIVALEGRIRAELDPAGRLCPCHGAR